MRLLHNLAKVHASFDDPGLVPRAVLVPSYAPCAVVRVGGPGRRACQDQQAGRVKAEPNVSCLVAGMAADAGSIHDMDVLRCGARLVLFGGLRAPSALGTFFEAHPPRPRYLNSSCPRSRRVSTRLCAPILQRQAHTCQSCSRDRTGRSSPRN
jgi:hypothetical protein